MPVFALTLSSLLVLYVALLRPVLRRKRYQKFAQEVVVNPALRSQYYLRTSFVLWSWVAVIGIVLFLCSVTPSVLGVRAPGNWTYTLLILIEILVLLPLVVVIMVRRLVKTRRPGQAKALLKIKELLPSTAHERRLWLLLSISAGICEELLFRGFLPWYFLALGAFFGRQISLLPVFALSTFLFGFAHLYQGWKGVLGTGLLGAVFAFLYVFTGNLIVPIVFHILIDARLVFFAPALLSLDRQMKAEDGASRVGTPLL